MFDNHDIFQAICRTLAHSLWQGLLLALLAGMVVVLTRKTSSALRYNLLALLGLVFICSVGFTLYFEIQTNKPVTYHSISFPESSRETSPVLVTYNNQHLPQQQQTVIDSVTGFLDQNALWIVALWFAFFVFKCVQLLKGLAQVHYLRHHKIYKASAEWDMRLRQLQGLLHMRKKVRLFESQLVSAPVMIGFLKPVILVPVGLLAHMPVAEAEAMLLHELAHIRRKDYLVNMIQGIGEVLFFFNPGFMWLSALLKTERENCCDDMAIAATQSKKELVKALVYSQEFQWNQNQLALGFGRKKTPLLDRARRILYNHNQSLNNLEKTFLTLCIVLGLGIALAFKSHTMPNDTVMLKHNFSLRTVSEMALSAIQHRAPEQPMGAETCEHLDVPEAPAPLSDVELADFEDIVSPPVPPVPPAPPSPVEPIAPPAPPKLFGYSYFINSPHDDSLGNKKMLEAERRVSADLKKMSEEMKKAEREIEKAEKEMRKAEIEMKKAEAEMARAEIALAEVEKTEAQPKEPNLADIILQDLEERFGKVSSYEFNEKKLVVNGQKQSADFHLHLSKKYIKGKMSVTFHQGKTHRNVTINVEN